jgi:hypothetical protein
MNIFFIVLNDERCRTTNATYVLCWIGDLETYKGSLILPGRQSRVKKKKIKNDTDERGSIKSC